MYSQVVTTALHELIADSLREQIRLGELVVGAPVPSESRLCEQWNASRGPVRQALATLRTEGVIAGGRGKPPVVCTASTGQPFDTLLSYSAWAHSIGRKPGQRTLELALRRATCTPRRFCRSRRIRRLLKCCGFASSTVNPRC